MFTFRIDLSDGKEDQLLTPQPPITTPNIFRGYQPNTDSGYWFGAFSTPHHDVLLVPLLFDVFVSTLDVLDVSRTERAQVLEIGVLW